jgi:hypothetical protein
VLPTPAFSPASVQAMTGADGGVTVELVTTVTQGQLSVLIYAGAPTAFAPGTAALDARSGGLSSLSADFAFDQGQLVLTEVRDGGAREFSGHLDNARVRQLRQVIVDAGVDGGPPVWAYQVDPRGSCYTLPATSFNTTVDAGAACLDDVDCGNGRGCDVLTGTCQTASCGADNRCGAADAGFCSGHTCVYPCDFFHACPSGLECDATLSQCRQPTPGVISACAETDTTMGCDVGLVCKRFPLGGSCVLACDPFETSPGSTPCASNQRCFESGRCDAPAGNVSVAQLGDLCVPPTSGVDSFSWCADDGVAYRGVCSGAPETNGGSTIWRCRPTCVPGGPACATGTCQRVVGFGAANSCRLFN